MRAGLMGTSFWTEVLAVTADKPLWLVTLAAMLIHRGPDYLKVILEHRRAEARLGDEQTRNCIMMEQAIAEVRRASRPTLGGDHDGGRGCGRRHRAGAAADRAPAHGCGASSRRHKRFTPCSRPGSTPRSDGYRMAVQSCTADERTRPLAEAIDNNLLLNILAVLIKRGVANVLSMDLAELSLPSISRGPSGKAPSLSEKSRTRKSCPRDWLGFLPCCSCRRTVF